MTHKDINNQEIIERYVRRKLGPEEQTAFEEHFFGCDECFEKVQMTERFVAGVRYAARTGLLEGLQPAAASWASWLKPAFAVVGSAGLLLALALAWILMVQIPQLREETARERRQREQAEIDGRQEIDHLSGQLQGEQQQRAELEKELALAKTGSQTPAPFGTEANIPLITLESTREAASNELALSTSARSFILWFEVDPEPRFAIYRLELYDRENHLIQTVKGLRRNSDGGLTVIFPAKAFQTGKYRLKLYGAGSQQSPLVGEYFLQLHKR